MLKANTNSCLMNKFTSRLHAIYSFPIIMQGFVTYWKGSAIFTMNDKFKQNVCIIFCIKFSKSTMKTHKMLSQIFGSYYLNQTGF